MSYKTIKKNISTPNQSILVGLHRPIIQAIGRLPFEVNAMLHYTVNQPPLWFLWGNPGMARCQEMPTLLAGYIPQRKVTSARSTGSLGFIVCEVLYDG